MSRGAQAPARACRSSTSTSAAVLAWSRWRLLRGLPPTLSGVDTGEPGEAPQRLRDALLRHLEQRGGVAPGAARGSERGSYQRVARDVGDGGDAVRERPLRHDREKVCHKEAPRTPTALTVGERGAAVAADGALCAAAHAPHTTRPLPVTSSKATTSMSHSSPRSSSDRAASIAAAFSSKKLASSPTWYRAALSKAVSPSFAT